MGLGGLAFGPVHTTDLLMIKSIIASIALGTSVVMPQAAMASEVSLINAQDSTKIGVPTQLASLVERAGVPVVDGTDFDNCNQAGYNVYGLYSGSHNAIVMCLNNIETAQQYVNTYTHEAVHLVQDCRAGLDNHQFDSGKQEYIDDLWAGLSAAKQDNIINSYDHTEWNDEIEAFFWENSPEVVAKGVSKFCF